MCATASIFVIRRPQRCH